MKYKILWWLISACLIIYTILSLEIMSTEVGAWLFLLFFRILLIVFWVILTLIMKYAWTKAAIAVGGLLIVAALSLLWKDNMVIGWVLVVIIMSLFLAWYLEKE